MSRGRVQMSWPVEGSLSVYASRRPSGEKDDALSNDEVPFRSGCGGSAPSARTQSILEPDEDEERDPKTRCVPSGVHLGTMCNCPSDVSRERVSRCRS